jgi:hypothetical protein
MLVLFVIAAVWILAIVAALALSVASRRLDAEIALDRQLAPSVSATDLAV